MVELLEWIGRGSRAPFGAPVLIWTGLAGAVAVSLTMARGLHPLMGYRLRQAVLLALPTSILVALWLPSEPSFVPPVPASVATSPPPGPDVDVAAALLGSVTVIVLLLMMVRLWMLATDLRRLRSLRRAAVPVDEPVPNRVLGALAAQFGIGKPIELLEGPPGSVPMTFGGR